MASYSTRVKNELSKLPLEESCCIAAETLGLFRMNGAMILEKGQWGALFETRSASTAHLFLTLVRRSGLQLATETAIQKTTKLQKKNLYQLRLLPSKETLSWLKALGIISEKGLNMSGDKAFIRKHCCQRSYLRGAFLGGGSVNKPEGRYHLELATGSGEFAQFLQKMLMKFGLNPKISERSEEYVVYLKEGDAITHFLQIIGATTTLLEFENMRILKERREYANRASNCEVANVQKTVNAAVRQLEIIDGLRKANLLEKLPLSLREAAILRWRYPEESLKDLASRFSGNLSKSGLNHRFKKLEFCGLKLLEELRTEKNK